MHGKWVGSLSLELRIKSQGCEIMPSGPIQGLRDRGLIHE
jgi:hypothetical protein